MDKPSFEREIKLELQVQALQNTIRALREALDWSGFKVSTGDLLVALEDLGQTGTRREAQIRAAVEYVVHMRAVAQRVLRETQPS